MVEPSDILPSGLAVDFGGTKIAAARLLHGEIQKQVAAKTDGDADAPTQVRAITGLLDQLEVRDSDAIGVAVAGRVTGKGVWHPVNSATLAQFESLALADILSTRYNRDVRVLNDAVSTAIGEHLAGAGRGFDRIGFLTISTGVGGGFVLDGTPLISDSGLAGHVGFTTSRLATDHCGSGRAKTVESIASGRAIARAAAAAGHPGIDAKAVFHAHLNGKSWAKDIIHTSANTVAELVANLKAMLDLDIVLLGGSIGLAPGYLALIDGFLKDEPPLFRPRLELAALGLRGAFFGVLTTQTL